MDGFFYINKNPHMTSFDVIRVIKNKFNLTKIGHTGTLDPLASGLLVICVGKATKLANEITNYNKTYEAEIVFGANYDTLDITGKVIDYIEPPKTIDSKLLIDTFKTSYYQEPPMYSAIKSGGRKLYELARENKTIEREKRLVHIYNLEVLKPYKDYKITLLALVSKGTYIRSLALDIGKYFKTYGAINSLNRTKIGNIDLKKAVNINDVSQNDFISLETYLQEFPKLILDDYLIHLVKNGVYLDERQTTYETNFVVYNKNNEMIAYYKKIANYKYKPILML